MPYGNSLAVLENSTPPLESGPEHEVSRRVERMRGRSLTRVKRFISLDLS